MAVPKFVRAPSAARGSPPPRWIAQRATCTRSARAHLQRPPVAPYLAEYESNLPTTWCESLPAPQEFGSDLTLTRQSLTRKRNLPAICECPEDSQRLAVRRYRALNPDGGRRRSPLRRSAPPLRRSRARGRSRGSRTRPAPGPVAAARTPPRPRCRARRPRRPTQLAG